MTAAPRALSQQDAATYLGISVRSLQRLTERGDLTPVYLTSRPTYLRAELDAVLEAAPTQKPA